HPPSQKATGSFVVLRKTNKMSDQGIAARIFAGVQITAHIARFEKKILHPLLFPPERATIAPFRGWLTTL
ncbi:MAG: hypothetical protein WBC78_19115, partial [Candidatus Sulfotelmatobacter sp.]